MPIKLVVLDLDGTTLKSNQEIHPKNLEIIQRMYKEKPDIKLIIATGRSFFETIEYAKELQINQKTGYLICYNGGSIINILKDKIKIEKNILLSCQVIKSIKSFAKENNIQLCGYDISHKLITLSYDIDYQDNTFYKLILKIGDDKKSKIIANELEKKFFDAQIIIGSDIEIEPNLVDKHQAVEYLCKLWNIQPEEVLACGDEINDKTLIEWVKYGIVMGNANPWNATRKVDI